MSVNTVVELGRAEVDSIVLDAAETEVRRLGFTISARAKDFLLRHSLPALDRENEEGRLQSRRAEVERNTAALIQYICAEEVGAGPSQEITYQHMLHWLSEFCKKHPDAYPICPV